MNGVKNELKHVNPNPEKGEYKGFRIVVTVLSEFGKFGYSQVNAEPTLDEAGKWYWELHV